MRRAANWLLPCLIAALLLAMLAFPDAALTGARDGLLLWAKHVLPALLPYCILAQMLIESGAIARIGRRLARPMRALYRLPGAAGPSLPLALMSGSPAAARIAQQLAGEGLLAGDETARFTAAGAMAGPLFLAGTAGGLLGDARAGWLALSACLVAALLNGLLWRAYGRPAREVLSAPAPLRPALGTLPGAIRDACISCITVGGTIAFFAVLTALLKASGALSLLAAPLSPLLGGDLAQTMLMGVMEMTGGIRSVAALPFSIEQRAALTAALASFGGLSIAAQAAVFLKDIVPMRLYLLQRATQAVIGYVSAVALAPLFYPGAPAFAGRGGFCLPCVLIFLLAVVVVFLVYCVFRPFRPHPPMPPRPPRPPRPSCDPCRPRASCAGCPMAAGPQRYGPRR